MKVSTLLWIVFVCAPPLWAQHLPPATRVDAGSLAAFADGFLQPEMAKRNIPGAVFVVVAEREVVMARGFGSAELESGRAVDPERTIFHVGSVSKVVTATAALQLVERGRLDLTKDVNAYLKSFQLPPYQGASVTLHHLLTHTAGFEERLIGVSCNEPAERQSLASYLAQAMPPRFAKPGEVISYSNHGLSLAGLLVEEVSGRRFEDYVRDEILAPLGMRRSGFLLTGDVAQDFARSYDFVDGHYRPLSPECVNIVAAGGFATTGTDMARFLIAHLQGGAYESARILREDNIDRMHARQFTPHPGLSGWAYGFWEDLHNGRRGLMHDGGGKGYRALIYLLPDQQLGFFLAYNRAENSLLEDFKQRFLDTFVPATAGQAVNAVEPMSLNFAGYFRHIRRARTTVEKIISVFDTVRIEQAPSGSLTMIGAAKQPITLTATGPMLFRRSDDRGLVAFAAAESNELSRLILDGGMVKTYDRISYFSALSAQAAWLLSMALAFAYAGIGRPLFAVARSMRRQRAHPPIRKWEAIHWSAWMAGIASVLNLIFMVAFPIVFIGKMTGRLPEFIYGVPRLALALLLIPPLTGALAVATSVAVFGLWRERRHRLATRLAHTIICAALLSFTAFTLYWRLMGIQI